jgi:hypothetical protein
MLISTLRDYVRKMGGELVITAHFPDREPVRIDGLADIGGGAPGKRASAGRARVAARSGKVSRS